MGGFDETRRSYEPTRAPEGAGVNHAANGGLQTQKRRLSYNRPAEQYDRCRQIGNLVRRTAAINREDNAWPDLGSTLTGDVQLGSVERACVFHNAAMAK